MIEVFFSKFKIAFLLLCELNSNRSLAKIVRVFFDVRKFSKFVVLICLIRHQLYNFCIAYLISIHKSKLLGGERKAPKAVSKNLFEKAVSTIKEKKKISLDPEIPTLEEIPHVNTSFDSSCSVTAS